MSMLLQWMKENHFVDVLPIINRLVHLLSTIPATSCTAERSFSALRRTLTWLRSTMKEDRLKDLAVIAIERDLTINILKNNLDKIVDAFAAIGDRRDFFF